MPIDLEWRLEPVILLATMRGVVTADEIEEWLHDFTRSLDSAPEAVHLIIDLRPMTQITANLLKMPNLSAALSHPHGGWTAVIGITPLVSFWLELLGRTTRLRYKLFPDVEDAAEFLMALMRIANE